MRGRFIRFAVGSARPTLHQWRSDFMCAAVAAPIIATRSASNWDRAGESKLGSSVAFIPLSASKGARIAVGITPDLKAANSVVGLVRVGAAALGGFGGGRLPDMAHSGGAEGEKAEVAPAAIAAAIQAA